MSRNSINRELLIYIFGNCLISDFCKQLVASGNYSDVDVSEPSLSSEEENNSEKPFSSARHPFSVRDSKPILMNIRVSLLTSTLDINP